MLRFKAPRCGIWFVLAVVLGLGGIVRSSLEPAGSAARIRMGWQRNIFSSKVYGFLKRPQNRATAVAGSLSNSGIYRPINGAADKGARSLRRQELSSSFRAVFLHNRAEALAASVIPIESVPARIVASGALRKENEVGLGATNWHVAGGAFSAASGGRLLSAAGDFDSGLDGARLTLDDPQLEGNPFLLAIRESMDNHPASGAVDSDATPAPMSAASTAPPPAQQDTHEETSVVKSPPPPPPPNADREVGQTLPPRTESNAPALSSAYVVVGDFGNHRLQIARAARSSSSSFALEGNLGTARFESGLNFGPLQTFWLGNREGRPFSDLVVTDGLLSLIDWYTGTAPGQFTFQNGFYFSAGPAAGAAVTDVNGDGAVDLIVGSQPNNPELADQGLVSIYRQQNGVFSLGHRILVGFPIGGLHVSRVSGRTRILAVDRSLTTGQVIWVDTTLEVTLQAGSVVPLQRQDVKLAFSDGKAVAIRLAEFAEATFLGTFEEGDFRLIATVDAAGLLPLIAVGDLQQDGQRRCWVRF